MFCITGCDETSEIVIEEKLVRKDTVINEYQVPTMNPKVMASQEGYQSSSVKKVLFIGEGLGDDFYVYQKDTDEMVYQGDMEEYSDTVKYGYFTEIEEEGTYYIETEVIGQSNPFIIEENLYQNLLESLNESYDTITLQSENIIPYCEGIVTILVAMEFYPQMLLKEGDITLLTVVKEKTEALLSLEKNQKLTIEEKLMVSGTLAKFSAIYEEADLEFSQLCLEESTYYWNETKQHHDDEATYFAATELFKTTSQPQYHNKVKELYNKFNHSTVAGKKQRLFGDITYLSTRNHTSVSICNEIMESRLKNVQDTAKENSGYQTTNNENEQIMYEVIEIIMIDHMFENKAYVTTLIDKLYYLLGSNTKGISYKNEKKDGVGESTLILLLSSIMERELLFNEKGE